jgi:hypothetical protein
MNDTEVERMWKEAVVTYSEILSKHFTGGTEETFEKPVKTVGVPAENRTRYFPNTSLELYCWSQWRVSVNMAMKLLVLQFMSG